MRIGILGARGVVGETLLNLLREKDFPVSELFIYSGSSHNEVIEFRDEVVPVRQFSKDVPDMDILFSCVDASVALNLIPKFTQKGVRVIDNSSAFRLKKEIPLVVPEVNPGSIKEDSILIANPNCSTIQLVIPLKALESHRIEEVFLATYQSVSGAGKEGIRAYEAEKNGGSPGSTPFEFPIFENLFPKIGNLNGEFSVEEQKIIKETEKILCSEISIFPTCVRVPVLVGHCQAVTVKAKKPFNLNDVIEDFEKFPSLELTQFPTPQRARGQDKILIGRLRVHSDTRFLSFFSAFDNLRKGAATNALQIALILSGNL